VVRKGYLKMESRLVAVIENGRAKYCAYIMRDEGWSMLLKGLEM